MNSPQHIMGDTIITPEALEDAMPKESPSLSPNPLGSSGGPRVEFYNNFKREADECDRQFVKRYDVDLNITLVPAALLSAVTSAFIIDIQRKLEPDYQEMSYRLLAIVANVSLGNTPASVDAAFAPWNGPDPIIIRVQTILYASLAASLLAVFIAMLGKQWLTRYVRTEIHGSVIDYCRYRQRQMDGMITWQFDLVMECLPLMLQAALLLLSYALSNYLFFLEKIIASTIIGFTAFGLLFYVLLVSAATFSYDCPFQTPISLVIHSLIHYDRENEKYLERSREWFGRIFSQKEERPRRNSGSRYGLGGFDAFDGGGFGDHIRLPMVNLPNEQRRLFSEKIDWDGYTLDSRCIARMFDLSMDADAIATIMMFIPEVVWYAGIRTAPLERLYDTVVECFDHSSGSPVVIPKLKNKAYLSAKAFLHVAIQSKCIGGGRDKAVFESISRRHQIMGSEGCDGDPDLQSTLGIIDHVFGNPRPMDWQGFTFTVAHHAWMGHILLYRAWDVTGKGGRVPDDIRGFTLHSLRLEPPPPASIVADCLFIIGFVVGIGLHPDDLLVVDKSRRSNFQIDGIYDKLTATFNSSDSVTAEIDRALEAMELISPLSKNEIAQNSYRLFHVIMQAPVTDVYSREKKWEASRLALHGAYRCDKFLPPVGDPLDVLIFLDHHFDLITGDHGENHDEPIENALCALAYASDPATIEGLKGFDPTQPSFVRGICYAYQGDRPLLLRKAAFFFLPLIGDRWFDTPDPIMKPDQAKNWYGNWNSIVHGVEHTQDTQKAILSVLLEMINSPHWRPHVAPEDWELLKYLSSVPDDFRPLRKCIDNPELIGVIRDTENQTPTLHWLPILWLKHQELDSRVREGLETFTGEIAQGGKRMVLNTCLSTMDSELEKAERALMQYTACPDDPAAVALRTKIETLQQAKVSLLSRMAQPDPVSTTSMVRDIRALSQT